MQPTQTCSFSTSLFRFLLLLLTIVASWHQVRGQAGMNDPIFNPTDLGFGEGMGFNAAVLESVLQPDGKILYSGNFTSFNGATRNRIARLNADGTLDETFAANLGANNSIGALVLQPDGKILIGGFFTEYDGVVRNRIARLNADGTLDPTFDPGTGADLQLHSIAIQVDGKIVIGGLFTTYNSTPRNRVARLNQDGSLDTTFDPGTGASFTILTIAIQQDGRILIGGQFVNYNGTLRQGIARLQDNGSLDVTFDPGSGTNSLVESIILQPDGKILIGGQFTTYNGTARARLARIHTDGTLDSTFDLGSGANATVSTIALQANGHVVIGGFFTNYNGTSRNRIARVNTDGSLDASFDPNSGASSTIYTILLQPDEKILINGDFTLFNTTFTHGRARLNNDGTLDETFSNDLFGGANRIVGPTSIQTDQKILVGGGFTGFNGVQFGGIVRLDLDGDQDLGFTPGTGVNGFINGMVIQPDGKIVIAGGFTDYDGVPRNDIARINQDGTIDFSFDPGTGINNFAATVALQLDGKIIISGIFTNYNGTTRNSIVRINSDGSVDTSFDPGTGTTSQIRSISIQADGKILIGGSFTSFNGIARNRIARLNEDGSVDLGFDPGSGANSTVESVLVQPDGKILIGGSFNDYNGIPRNYVARLNADGSLDTTFVPEIDDAIGFSVRALSLQADGKILAGGNFPSPYKGLTRLLSSGELDSSFKSMDGIDGSNAIVYSITQTPDNKAIIAGDFFSYNGIGRNRIARIFLEPSLETDSLALVALYNATNGPGWTDNTNWLTGSVDTWYGVGVNGGRVEQLSLTNNNLSGPLPTEIGNLTALQYLDLGDNQLTGSLPTSIGSLTSLLGLSLYSNSLQGTIPPVLGNLTNLTSLSFEDNELSGNIPTELGNLTSLTYLSLPRNQLDGSIPTALGNLTALQELILYGNRLSGAIPSELGNLANLTRLDLNNNQLIGTLPASFSGLSNLTDLSLHENLLTGLIDLTALPSLTSLDVDYNHLTYEDLEPNAPLLIDIEGFQRRIGNLQLIELTAGQSQLLSFSVDGSANQYQWLKDNVPIPGAESDQLSIPSFSAADAGEYVLRITNSIVSSYELFTASVFLFQAGTVPENYTAEPTSFGYTNLTAPNFLLMEDDSITSALPIGFNFNFYGVNYTQSYVSSNGFLSFLDNQRDGCCNGEELPDPGQLSFLDDDYKVNGIIAGYWADLNPEDGGTIKYQTTGAAPNRQFVLEYENVPACCNPGNPTTSFQIKLFETTNNIEVHCLSCNEYKDLITQGIENQGGYLAAFLPGRNRASFSLSNDALRFTPPTNSPRKIDSLALVALYNATNGPGWATRTNWLTGPIDTWSGVNVVSDRVSALSLHDNQLTGTLPSEIGNLTALTSMVIHTNQITGSIPASIGNLSGLTTLYINTNQLSGTLPTSMGNLTNLANLAIHNNQLTGIVPNEFANLSNLVFLRLDNNSFSQVPDFSGISGLTTLNVSNNNLTFEDIQPNLSVAGITYAPQKTISALPNQSVAVGEPLNLTYTIGGTGNQYQWFKDAALIGGATSNTYTKTFALTDVGDYYLQITNPAAPLLTLLTGTTSVTQDLNLINEGDSLALVALYNATNGPGWTNNTNWLTGKVETWFGVTVTAGRVTTINLRNNNLVGVLPAVLGNNSALTGLDLAQNQLTGTIPQEFGNLSALTFLYLMENQLTGSIPPQLGNLAALINLWLQRNQLSGTIPPQLGNLAALRQLVLDSNQLTGDIPPQLGSLSALIDLRLFNNQLSGAVPIEFGDLAALNYIFLHENQLTDLPDLSGLSSLISFRVENNHLTFEDIEPNIGIANFTYTPQDSVGVAQSLFLQTSSSTSLETNVGGTANQYQWLKNGTVIAGATGATYPLINPSFDDEGVYTFRVTNTLAPALTLQGRPVSIKVSSLQRDSIALRAFYNATGGPSWVNQTGWTTDPLTPGAWHGVTLNNNRVTELRLPNNNLTGKVPAILTDIENLQVVDLSGNFLTALPDLTAITTLTELDVSENALDFSSLINNASLLTVDYRDQADLGTARTDSIRYNTDFKVGVAVQGEGNRFQWLRNGTAVSGATDSVYVIPALNRTNMGEYRLEITNPAVPNLTLRSAPQRVLATATLSGQLLEEANVPITKGLVRLLRIPTSGGYDTLRTQTVNNDGTFSLNNVVLDDYLLLGDADTVEHIGSLPTYLKSVIYWEEADTLFVNEDREDLDIVIQKRPAETPKGTGLISGVFEDTNIQEDGRTLRNKRIANAGASVRRRVNVGKPEDEELVLVAWIFTNEEGEFEFNNLEQGEYLLNLQYPGYPMDPTSFINISIGTGLSRRVQVEALVEQTNIVVKKLVVTGWDEAEQRFAVFPNPANGNMHIKILHSMNNLTYSIANALGSEVLQGTLPFTGVAHIETGNLPAGVYVVTVAEGGATLQTFRMVITH